MFSKIKKPLKVGFTLLLCSIIFTGCMSSISVQVLVPADIMLPEHIKKVVVANRFRPESKKDKIFNILEGVITGEGFGVDREGADRAVAGLVNALSRSPRFDVVQTNEELKGTGTGAFPTPLPHNKVKQLCKNSNAQALIVMATFDSDSNTKFETKQETVKDKEGNEKTKTYYIGHRTTTATAGWRIYNMKDGQILDEFKASNTFNSDIKTNTREEARLRLITQRQAVVDAGYFLGEIYAPRISPTWTKVNRSYYTGKKPPEMKTAKTMVITNDWARAAELWSAIVNNDPKTKTKGKAAYNMALANEVQGNLPGAVEWAKKSAYDFGNKKARSYINVLEARISEQRRLNQQMGK